MAQLSCWGWPTVLVFILLPIADDLCKSCGAFIYIVAMLIYRDRGVKVKIRSLGSMFRLKLIQCRLALYPLRAEQPCTQPTDGADRPNAHNIAPVLRHLDSRRSGHINPTLVRHDHRADAIHSLYITVSVPIHVTNVCLLSIHCHVT